MTLARSGVFSPTGALSLAAGGSCNTEAALTNDVPYADDFERYALGTPLGSLLGAAMGGVVADAYGWRAAFMVAGAPGLVVAALAAFTLIEPRSKTIA